MTADLNTAWFVLVGMLLTGYALLDGFDLGVGALHLWVRKDEHRRIFLNAIGPVWDGNEVWLVTGGGALFAAFPRVYASVCSGFYLPFMALLCMLIFRAVSIEFRSKQGASWWRQAWDVGFAAGSVGAALLTGIALGNIAWGIPLDGRGHYAGSFVALLSPYPLLVGVTTLALFMMHGCIFLLLKTEGELHAIVRGWVRNTIIFFTLSYMMTTMATLLYVPHMTEALRRHPQLLGVAVLTLLAVANIPREVFRRRDFRAFLSSCAAVALLLTLFGIGMYPHMVYSNPAAAHSLTIYNAASSPKTLRIMLVIAMLGVPLVLSYTVSIYWIFRGKVRLDASSY